MGQISLTLPADGTTIEAADVNNPFNALLNEFNGNIDDNNIKSGANISGTKLNDNTLPPSKFDANARAAWLTSIMPVPNTITALGNRSYSLVFNATDLTGYLGAGMRLRTTRTSAAPTQCTSLNGSTQYYSKTSPAGMTFTDDFIVSAWIKLSSYPAAAAAATIASRFNNTSGWAFQVVDTGQVQLVGFNAAGANFSKVVSYQSVPLNKWVHVTAQLDMSAFTATTITSYVMLDGVDVPASVSRGGTNPTALIQAGDLNIGSYNAGAAASFFAGKIAQVAIYSAKVTQATILASMNQGLAGTETSLISAYSFNNSINDLNTTNANNLTTNGSAVATNADSPFGGQASGLISSTLDYAIVTAATFSTNTTLTVQVPEGCAIPTSGGLSAIAYANVKSPYGMPVQKGKWRIEAVYKARTSVAATTAGTWYYQNQTLNIPIGEWCNAGYDGFSQVTHAGAVGLGANYSFSTSTSAEGERRFTTGSSSVAGSQAEIDSAILKLKDLSLSAATPYYLVASPLVSTSTIYIGQGSGTQDTVLTAELAHL